jgi:hypothetical protein
VPEVQFYGETFHVTDEPNEFAMMEFADTAEQVEDNSLPALAALFRLLHESVAANPFDETSSAESEWARFRKVARANRADSATLLPVVFAVYSEATERPTVLPSASSDGPEPTPLRSVSPPDVPVSEPLSGRPDLQSALLEARAARAVRSA